MDDRIEPKESAEDNVGKVGGIVALALVLFGLVVLMGTGGVFLAAGFLTLWGVFSLLSRLFNRREPSE